MLFWLILIIIGIYLVGFGILYISFRSKVKTVVEKNEATEIENQKIDNRNKELIQKN
jgi:archaellum component FlaF (FlaF/FlaG flagellin family)